MLSMYLKGRDLACSLAKLTLQVCIGHVQGQCIRLVRASAPVLVSYQNEMAFWKKEGTLLSPCSSISHLDLKVSLVCHIIPPVLFC
jgi:hypothetical protein